MTQIDAAHPVGIPGIAGEAFMTANEIIEELRTLGSESIKKVLRNHGVREPFSA
jgi:hypothetical protein